MLISGLRCRTHAINDCMIAASFFGESQCVCVLCFLDSSL